MNIEQQNDILVEAIQPEFQRNPLWPFGKAKIRVSEWVPGSDLFLQRGRIMLQRLSPDDGGKELEGQKGDLFIRVYKGPHAVELGFSALGEDAASQKWDVVLSGTFTVSESQMLLESFALNVVSPGAPVRVADFASWLTHKHSQEIGEEVRNAQKGFTFEEFRERPVLALSWWQKRVGRWLEKCGVFEQEIVADVRWESAEAARAEAERQRQAALEHVAKQKEEELAAMQRGQELEAELDEKQQEIEAKHQLEKQRIQAELQHDQQRLEHDLRLAQETRDHQLRLLQTEYGARLGKAELETQGVRQQIAIEAARHLVALAKLEEELAVSKQALADRERQHQQDFRNQQCLAQAEFERKQEQARLDSRRSQVQVEQDLERLKQEHALKLAQLEEARQQSQRNGELAAAAHLLALARSRAALAAVQHAEVEQQKEREHQTKLRELIAQAEFEKEQWRIELDAELSKVEKDHQVQLAEQRRKKEITEARKEADEAERVAEKAAKVHELAMVELQNRIDNAQKDKSRQEQAEQQQQKAMDTIIQLSDRVLLAETTAQSTTDRVLGIAEMLAKLLLEQQQPPHQVLEWATLPQLGGLRPSQFGALGHHVAPQMLVHNFRDKSQEDGEPIRLHKVELRKRGIGDLLSRSATRSVFMSSRDVRTRDVLTKDIGTVPVDGLPINSSLQFELTSKRAGYVTLLNIGTSGSIYLHVPNAYVGSTRAKVEEAGRRYYVPGPELLPREELSRAGLDYFEAGPPGWEHLAVIISHQPLVDEGMLARLTPRNPLAKFSHTEFADFCARLAKLGNKEWSVGVLSFLVAQN